MKKAVFGLVALSLVSLSACAPLEQGELIDPAAVSGLNVDANNDEKRFMVKGYPYAGGDVYIGREYSMPIYTGPNGEGVHFASLPVNWGQGKNDFYVPDNFTTEDIVIYDNEGVAHSYNEELYFSFTIDLKTERAKTVHPITKEESYFYAYEGVRIDPVK